MKNNAVKALIAKQYNIREEEVTIEFIAHDKNGHEFKVTALDKEESARCNDKVYETTKVTIKSEPWINDIFN